MVVSGRRVNLGETTHVCKFSGFRTTEHSAILTFSPEHIPIQTPVGSSQIIHQNCWFEFNFLMPLFFML